MCPCVSVAEEVKQSTSEEEIPKLDLYQADEKLHNDGTDDCPQPRDKPPAPFHKNPNDSWEAPDTLRTADLDATHISEFTVDAHLMGQLLAKDKHSSTALNTSVTINEPHKENEFIEPSMASSLNPVPSKAEESSVPVKVAWGLVPDSDPQSITSDIVAPPNTTVADRPNVLNHFFPSKNTSLAAAKTYIAPHGEEALQLSAVVG